VILPQRLSTNVAHWIADLGRPHQIFLPKGNP
jgi:hypothetical protein